MLNEYDIINEYRGKSQEMLNEYDLINKYAWKFYPILEQYLENSLLLQSNKLGQNYFKEK